jgi:perosamine synthetase
LPFFVNSLAQRDIDAVVECLRSGWLTTGPRTREFERRFAEKAGAKEAVAVTSCTAAMHLSLEACGVGPGDEVIVPTLTFVATAQATLYCGATPVLVDCRKDDLTIDVEAIQAALTPRTRAIMPMHYGGHPCDQDAIAQIAAANGLAVVEDAAHAVGGRYKGRAIGSAKDAVCFSFHATKPLTTGEGGMVTTADAALAQKIRLARLHAIRRDVWTRTNTADPWLYDVEGLGHKYNMPDILAALGLAQLDSLESDLRQRTEIAERYRRAFVRRDDLRLQSIRGDVVHAHHLFPVLLNIEALRLDRDQVMREMHASGVSTSLHYRPLHLFPGFAALCRIGPKCGQASEWVYERLITLPLYSRLSDQDVDRVCETLIGVLTRNRR